MNKIFRIVWSYATQSWVVVSELTKAHKKQSSSNSLKAALGAATVLLSINSAEAAVLIGATENDTTTATKINNQNSKVSSWGITIGGAISKAGEKSVHIGDASGSVGSRNVVIGTYASAGYDEHKPADNPEKTGAFNQSVAIGAGGAAGEGARAYGDQSIAIGSNTIARGNSSIAIGNDDVDKTGSTDTTYTDLNGKTKTGSIANAYNELTGQNLGVGQYQDTTSKEAAVAIGVKSVAGDISLALGTGANADRVNAVAIGTGATANRDNAVAIGGGSTTDAAATSELKTTVNGLTFNWAGGERTISGDVVSFGKEGYERQLKHVSPGKVSATSTDAINGSQLYGVLNHLTSDPVYLYGADDSSDNKVAGDDAAKKSADAKDKKIVARSMADSRLNLKGGATGELTDNNIGVKYEDEGTIRFKLAKALSGLTSAEFKDANNNVVNITPTGVSVKKPNATDANTVTLSQNGLNNGGNAITNVAGNLQGSKASSTAPTTNATAPNDVDGIKNNAATVGDVLQAGWNLQNNGAEKDFVKPYDTVNFVDGNGTTAVVDTTENKTSTVKYNVNLGNGLKTTDNKITVKPADKSLEVNKDGVKVKTDGTTITTDPTNGLKVVTGGIETGTNPGTMKVTDGDDGKIATVDSVVNAVNSAAFTLKANAIEGGTRNTGSTVTTKGESIKAGSTIEMIAGKNLEVTHNTNGKITFATVDNPSFSTVQVGDSEGPKFSGTSDGNIKVSGPNDTDPVKITNLKDGEISANSKDAINGSQFHKVANNTIKLAGQNGDDTATATETNAQNLNKQGGIKFTVKSSNGDLLDVTAAEDTITLTPKTAKITAGKDGVPTANTSGGKLVTADDLVKALKNMGWKATADKDGTGTVEEGNAEELIKAGNTVTFKAGNNLAVKQAGKEFIYSLQKELTGLTSAEFKGTGTNAPTTKLTNEGVTITPETSTGKNLVSLTQNGLNNGGNAITNVAGNLDGAKTGTAVPTTSATKPTLGTAANEVNSNNAATVGDVLNAGWNLQGNNEAKDFVTAYDTVNFVDGDGTSVSVTNTDNKTSTIKYSVNTGNGLQKDPTGNTISVKPADKSLEVTNNGVKVKAADNTLTTDDNGLKVNTGEIEPVKTGTNPGTVKVKDNDAGKIATVDSVVKAVNDAAFTLKASAIEGGTRNTNSTVAETGESIKAGNTIEMIAGKNLNVTHNTNGKITFATVENPSFSTVQIGNSEGPKFSATTDGNIRVSDKTDTKPVKITNVADGTISDTSKDAINGSQIHKLVNKAIKLAGQNGSEAAGETDPQNLTQQDPIKFTVKSSDGTLLHVAAAGDTITLTPKTGTITTGADGIPTVNTTGGKLVTADNLVKALTEMGWKATVGQEGSGTVADNAEQLIKAGETVTFKAGDNLAVKQAGKNFIYSLQKELTGLTSAEFEDGDNKVKITPTGITITKPAGTTKNTVTLNQNGLNNGGNPITNVISGLTNYTEADKHGLRNLTNNTVVPDTTAATVGDLRNMGWVVSSNKTTGNLGNPYSEAVTNANEVKFVGTGLATVSGKTENGVRTITVNVESKTAINAVTYTKPDGTPVYPVEGQNGTITYHTTQEGKGPNDETVDGSNVITSVNGPKGTKTPSTLSNVAGNLEGAKPNSTAPTTSATAPNNVDGIKNNAATVGDVLQAGWNLQNNDAAKDLVKPYDTVNFVNGEGTIAVVETTDNKVSTIKYNVNTGNGLQKDTTGNTISVKPADASLVVDANGVKVNTGTINTTATGTAAPNTGDENKVATVNTVVNAINNAAFTLKASATAEGTRNTGSTVDENGESIKAGNTVELVAGKNLDVKHEANGKITFATKDNVTFETVQVGGDQGPKLSKTGDGDLKVSGSNGTDPVKVTNLKSGLDTYGDNVPGTTDKNRGLVDLSKPANGYAPKVSDNTAATVGDLRNMGWIVSADKKTGDLTNTYSDTVKNANEVKFVGEGTAIVSGKTEGNVRTITVKVNDQVSTNNSVTAVNYTKADGTKVYPKMVTNPDTGKEELKFFEKPDGSGAEVPKGDVVTSINGPESTTSPTTLKNVKNNIPNVNDGTEDITKPDGTVVGKTPDNGNINKAPLTAEEAAKLSNPKTADGAANPKYIGNNAATVSDVLNAGWNLQNNGTAKDFVKPYDTVNFINGLGTTAVVTTRDGNTASDVTFNVKAANGSVTVDEDGVKVTTGEMKPAVDANQKETGAIAIPVDPAKAKELKDNLDAAVKELATAKEMLKAAETALAVNPNNATLKQLVEAKKADVAAKQAPVNTAQKAHDKAGLNKVATVQNVAEAINNSGFNLKTSADGGEKLTTGTKNDGELIKPSNTVEMVAGNNLTVKQDENGKITYATKDNVAFTNVATDTLNVGSHTYTDGKGNTYTKVGENYYKPADVVNGAPKPDATPVDVTTTPVTPVSPVTMKAEAAKPATNNATDAQPSSALNVTSKDGKPTQITGVGSTLNTKSVDTTPAGTAPGTTPNTTQANLIDLEGTADAPVNKNAAATVGDLQNMGWVVSAKDGNGYKDVVKNANVVDFKGSNGIEVTGKTLPDGTREITVGIKEGEVTNKVTITHENGTKTNAVKIGDNYYKVDKDGKPVGFEKGPDGKPAGTPLKVNPNTDTVTNAGAGVVTGNAVANAIQDSGWNVGIGSTDKDFSKDAKVYYDKVNPNDDVKFANGANTNVSMVTVDALNEDGTKKATTYVKVDINRDLKIDSVTTGGTATDKNGNNLVKVGDQYYKEGDVTIVTNPDGTTTVTPKENAKAVPPADVIPAKDGAMIVKNADGKDVVSATVGKDGNGAFGINGKDGKNGISMTAKDGQGTIGVNGKDGKSTTIAGDTITIKDKDNNATNIGVNTITLVDKAGNTTTTTADKSEIKDAAGNINANTATGNTLKDPNGNTHTSTASTSELKDKDGNTNTSTPTTNVLKDTNGNTNTSAATGTTYKDKDENKTVVGPKEINISDKSGENTASLTNKDLLLNAKDPNTGVDKTSHVSGDKIAFTTTDEMEKVVDKDGKPVIDPATGKQKEVVKMEKVFDKDGKPVIDPATGKQKEVVKNPGNSTEYTNEGLKVIPNSTVARDVNGNPTFLDKDGKPVMKDTDGKYKYVGQDGKPGDKYDGAVGVLKPNVVDNTRVISFGMDKPVLDKNGKPVTGPDGNPVMTEGISAGMQQIHNVAPGTKDTDGVNVSQLRGTTININNRMNRMGAQAAALAGLQSIQYDPLEPTQISAGLGHYKGSSALALGVNHFKNESTMFHMGASYNGHGDETMMNASVTWKFGARADETAVKDTFRQGPISSAYTLQDKVSALEAQNKIQKDQLEELKALNEKQQEQIAELFKRLIEKA